MVSLNKYGGLPSAYKLTLISLVGVPWYACAVVCLWTSGSEYEPVDCCTCDEVDSQYAIEVLQILG